MSGLGDFVDDVAGVTSGLGVFDPNAPLGLPSGTDFINDVTGETAAEAAGEGAALQVAAAKEALALLRGDLDPFKQLGIDQISGVQALSTDPAAQQALRQQTPGFSQFEQLSTDPQAQLDFLQNNPLFSSLQDQSRKDIFANQAARGKLSGSGTEELLQSRFLEQGNQLINQQLQRSGGAITAGQDIVNQQLNRQLPLLNLGQASAAQVGAGGVDLLTGAANAESAAAIAAANAQSQGAQNVASAGAGLLAFLSDKRLKSDIVKTGEHNGLNVYEWKWNKEANKLGIHGGGSGHIAQELQKTHPHLVGTDSNTGFFFVDYSTDETVDGDTWL